MYPNRQPPSTTAAQSNPIPAKPSQQDPYNISRDVERKHSKNPPCSWFTSDGHPRGKLGRKKEGAVYQRCVQIAAAAFTEKTFSRLTVGMYDAVLYVNKINHYLYSIHRAYHQAETWRPGAYD